MIEITIPDFDIALTADSGQCFRFKKLGEKRYQLIAHQKLLIIEVLDKELFLLHCNEENYHSVWHNFFDMERDYSSIMKDVPTDDAFLQAALRHAGGLRILQQEPWECLVSFIISQRKNIPAIKGCVEALSSRFGQAIDEDIFAFPTPQTLAAASIDELNVCSLGYRSAYIQKTARMIAEGQIDLHDLKCLPDTQLKEKLMILPGVGTKVADCVMLFSYGRTEAFPRDVWINRVIDRHYAGQSPADKLGPYAGILQQYMFCYIRSKEYKNMY